MLRSRFQEMGILSYEIGKQVPIESIKSNWNKATEKLQKHPRFMIRKHNTPEIFHPIPEDLGAPGWGKARCLQFYSFHLLKKMV